MYRLLGASFMACGLIPWRRRPDSHSGLLMTVTGLGFLVYPVLSQYSASVSQTAAVLLAKVWFVTFALLLLTLLSGGRPQAPVDWALPAAFGVGVLVLSVWWMALVDFPGNLLFVGADAGLAESVGDAQSWIVLAASGATALVVGLRFLRASPPRRRALLPSVAGALTLLVLAAQILHDLLVTTPSEALKWASVVSLLCVPVAFLAGLLRSRLARGGVAALLHDLPLTGGADAQAALARTLGDPGLALAGPRPGGGYADATGAPVAVPPGPGRTAARLGDLDDDTLLVYDTALDEDPDLVQAVVALAAMAAENARLRSDASQVVEELGASRERLASATQAERASLEQALHEGAQARLEALGSQLRMLQSGLRGDPEAERALAAAEEEVARSLDELGALVRGGRPAALDAGLEPALRSLVDRSPVPASLHYEGGGAVAEPVEAVAYFVAAEALTNVAKYARADRATVRVRRDGHVVTVEIEDDGVGGADMTAGTGLRGLRDRLAAVGGRLVVRTSPGEGTSVVAELPVGREGAG